MPYTTYNCDALTGGAARALDSYSVSVLTTGNRAFVDESGETLRFKYNSAGTAAENVSTHPYVVRPDDYSIGGNWEEQIAADRGDVSAAANLTANAVVVGDDGAKGVKSATGAVTIPTINLTGGQIAFPATAVPSADPNTLDDYEEGTWTPAITCQTPGNLSVAYTYQNGLYTKVGNHVSVTYFINTSAFTHTTASGAFRMSGLPFTSGATVVQPGFAGTFSGFTKVNYTQVALHVIQNSSLLLAYASAQGQTYAEIQITDFPTAGSVALIGSATYFI